MIRLVLVLAGLAILLGVTLLWLGSGDSRMEGASAPDGAAATSAPPDMAAPAGAADDAEAGEADNSFIVCPGDPRCP